MPHSILLIEDDDDFAESAMAVLASADYRVDRAGSIGEGRKMLQRRKYDLVLSDINLPDNHDATLVEKLAVGKPPPPVIVITAVSTFDRAVQATLCGAVDYLRKPVERARLLEAIARAIAERALGDDEAPLPDEAGEDDNAIIGQVPAMLHLFQEIGRIARQKTPVLVLGETGTGKELAARAIHRYGAEGAAGRPFVPVNCAAIPELLVESELFGHEKGAFTGAHTRKEGRFQEARGGTIFLDEVGELPLPTQAKLLRVLQEREVQPVGGTAVKVDARVVAATHRNLEAEVAAGRFREDLYFRLNVAVLSIPPLRERREDIPRLVAHFLRRRKAEGGAPLRLVSEAIRLLEDELWPGNVRELENVVRRAALTAAAGVVGPDHIRRALRRPGPSPLAPAGNEAAADPVDLLLERHVARSAQASGEAEAAGPGFLREMEREAIAAVLRRTKGVRGEAARLLGINRKTLREKLLAYGLDDGKDE